MTSRFIASLHAAWKRRRRLHDTRVALQGLDARALADIGLDASEILSIASEASGASEIQRISRFVPYY